MESAEQSDDSLDSTDQVPCPWVTDTDVDARAPAAPPVAPPQRRPIPHIVRRDGKPPVALAKPPASARPQASAEPSPQDNDTRPTIPLWTTMPRVSAPAKVEIAPVLSKVAPAVVPTPIPVVEPAPTPLQPTPPATFGAGMLQARKRIAKRGSEPRGTVARDAPVASPEPRAFGAGMLQGRKVRKGAALRAAEPLDRAPDTSSEPPAFGAGMLGARKRGAASGQEPRDTGHDATIAPVDASREPPTFGAGMLGARKVRAKPAAPRGGATLDREAAVDAPPRFGAPRDTVDHDAAAGAGAFGASMLQARKRGAPGAPIVGETFAAGSATFGAGMLRARDGRVKLVAGFVLAVAITAVCLAIWT